MSRPGTGAGPGFTLRRELIVDPTRRAGGAAGRHLPTDVYLPSGSGPFPLVVHAHGYDGAAGRFRRLLGAWAAAGIAVAAPDFPLTGCGTPGGPRIEDWSEQPADIGVVLDELLGARGRVGRLDGLVDPARVGVSGLSLGGATVYPLAFHDAHRDDRCRAAVLMSALELPLDGGDYDWTRRFPTLVFAGTADTSVSYDLQRATVEKLVGPSWFVTLEGGLHGAPFEDVDSPHDDVVVATSLAFWSATLLDDAAARGRVARCATVPGVASVEVLD